MPKKISSLISWNTDIRVAFFLALRDIKHANKWTTMLIIFVMTLTFLNLVVVSGILVGLIEGSVQANNRVGGNVVISSFLNKSYIENTPAIEDIAKTIPGFQALSVRYSGGARIESNYKTTIKPDELRDGASASNCAMIA